MLFRSLKVEAYIRDPTSGPHYAEVRERIRRAGIELVTGVTKQSTQGTPGTSFPAVEREQVVGFLSEAYQSDFGENYHPIFPR